VVFELKDVLAMPLIGLSSLLILSSALFVTATTFLSSISAPTAYTPTHLLFGAEPLLSIHSTLALRLHLAHHCQCLQQLPQSDLLLLDRRFQALGLLLFVNRSSRLFNHHLLEINITQLASHL
jgi:hypothetical protein